MSVKVKNESLLIIDCLAIICIVAFHAVPFAGISLPILAKLGLSLFSFSAGYKLMNNHHQELHNRVFLKQYMVERFNRLYRPYIGYTVLCLPILLISIYISKNIFNLTYPGLNTFDNPVQVLAWRFIIGENPVAYQLWYLLMLLEVTFFCLLILFAFNNIKILFGIGLASGLFYLFYHQGIGSPLLDRVVCYGTIFIIGMFLATKISFPERVSANLLKPIILVGSYSFYIYLFQWPFLIPIPGRMLYNVLQIQSILVPVFLVLLTIVSSIIIYHFTRVLGINRLFE